MTSTFIYFLQKCVISPKMVALNELIFAGDIGVDRRRFNMNHTKFQGLKSSKSESLFCNLHLYDLFPSLLLNFKITRVSIMVPGPFLYMQCDGLELTQNDALKSEARLVM